MTEPGAKRVLAFRDIREGRTNISRIELAVPGLDVRWQISSTLAKVEIVGG